MSTNLNRQTWAETAVAVEPSTGLSNSVRGVSSAQEVTKLLHKVDGGTGLRTKMPLLSQTGVQELNDRLPGEKLFFFWDFNNMGAPNRYGLRNEVTTVIKKINNIAAAVFKNSPYELFRLGGDEFCGVIETQHTDLVREFAWQLQVAIQQFFALLGDHSWAGEQIEKARRYVAIREGCKKIFREYREEFPDNYSLAHYLDWLQINCPAIELPKTMPFAQQIGILEVVWARQICTPAADFMTFSPVLINMGTTLSVDSVQRALALADQDAHNGKNNNQATEGVLEISMAVSQRENDVYERIMQQHREQEFVRLEQELAQSPNNSFHWHQLKMKKEALLLMDPMLEGVYRLDYLRQESLQNVLKVRGSVQLSVMALDVGQFGSINNHFGYSKGDEVMRDLVTTLAPVLKTLKKTFVLRAGGGKIVLVGFDDLTKISPDIKNAITLFERSLQSKLDRQQLGTAEQTFMAYVEAGRQQTLGDYSAGVNSLLNDLKFGKVALQPPIYVSMMATDKWSKLMDLIDR